MQGALHPSVRFFSGRMGTHLSVCSVCDKGANVPAEKSIDVFLPRAFLWLDLAVVQAWQLGTVFRVLAGCEAQQHCCVQGQTLLGWALAEATVPSPHGHLPTSWGTSGQSPPAQGQTVLPIPAWGWSRGQGLHSPHCLPASGSLQLRHLILMQRSRVLAVSYCCTLDVY